MEAKGAGEGTKCFLRISGQPGLFPTEFFDMNAIALFAIFAYIYIRVILVFKRVKTRVNCES